MKTYKRALFGIFLSATLISPTCKDEFHENSKAALNLPFELTVYENVIFSDIGLKIELSGVNDSRCPANVQCIWAGNAKLNLTISGGVMQNAVNLCLGQCETGFRETDTIAFNHRSQSYILVLKKVQPYPGTADAKKSAVLVLKKN